MFAPKVTPSVEIYSEDAGENWEISKEDITEFAKRIGIDVEREPNLLYLAKDGLEEKLPLSWKPCLDHNKKSWYYFNQETKNSQWEHPLNDVYRAKVSQVRSDLAMNRIETFDPSSSRPPRSLPPLKKLGSGRPPTGLNRLGPPDGSTTFNKSPSNTDVQTPRDRIQTSSLGDLQSRGSDNSDSQSLKNPSGRMVKRPLGLTLTGEGANFLKGSDGPSNNGTRLKKFETPVLNGADVEGQKNSLKSILTTSVFNSSNQSKILNKKYKNAPWGINPDSLTEEETKIVRYLDQQRPGVKFKLDENPALNFEISETDENDASEDKKSDESETEQESSEEEDKEPFGRIKNAASHGSSSQKSDSELENSSRRNVGAGEKISLNTNMSEAAVKARKETMRKNMEAKLKEYQEELDKERKSREDQIKKHMDMTVEQLKLDKESEIKRARNDLEQSKHTELDKVKRELESSIKVEVDKMKLNFDNELEKKKAEIRERHEQILNEVGDEGLDPLSEANQNDVLRRKYSEETLKLHAELKNHKEVMKEEQKRQIQQMKDYHKSYIDKLKADMKSEEQRLENKHQLQISGIMTKFEKETADVQAKLTSEQEMTLKRLMAEFEKEKSSVERELREGISSLNNDMKTLKSKVEASQQPFSSENASKSCQTVKTDEELKDLSAKYNQLEKKYLSLKKELHKISTVTNHSQTVSNKQSNESVHNVLKSEHVTLNTQQEVSESESDSHSETSFYPSSSVNRPQDKISDKDDNLNVKEIITDNNDRLGCALKSLEILKNQILEINKEQLPEKPVKMKTLKPSGRANSPKHGKKTPRHISPVSSARSTKKKISNQTGLKIPKKNTPVTPPPSRNVKMRPSKSTSELEEVVENSESNEIVKEAREFIRSQKERLSVPTNAKFENQISSTWTNNNASRYSLDEISYPPVSTTRNYTHSPKQDLYSETESSGVGSLKDLKSQEKKQISKDIEAICSSLSHLDDQMRLMWTVVQGNSQDKSNALNHNNIVTSLPNHIPAKPSTRKHTNQRPVTTMDLQSLVPTVSSTSNRAFIDSIKSTNLPSSRMTASNLLSSLDKELKEFKAAKERILSQYTSQKNTPSDSIQEKTKDLREWLDKF